MTLEFIDINFSGVHGSTNLQDRTWGSVGLGFEDTETKHCPRVEVSVLLPKRPETTIAQLQAEARDQARAILREALALLDSHDIATLERNQLERSQREREAAEASLGLSASE